MVIGEDLEQIGFCFRVVKLNDSLCYIKGRANVLLSLIDLLIERLCEQDCSFIEHKTAFFDTDDVLSSVQPKNLTDVLRVTGGHEDKRELEVPG